MKSNSQQQQFKSPVADSLGEKYTLVPTHMMPRIQESERSLKKNWPAAIEIMFLFRLLRLVRSKYLFHQMTHDRSTERLVQKFLACYN